MILTISILQGFKKSISEKVFGFWGHMHITDTRLSRSFELSPFKDDAALKDSILSIGTLSYAKVDKQGRLLGTSSTRGGVDQLNSYIMIPAILSNKKSMEGMVLKGVNEAFNWNKFESYLKEGRFPTITKDSTTREMLISEQTSLRNGLKIGDPVLVYFVNDQQQLKRKFKVSGIFRTGLEEYDRKFAFVDMGVIQQVLKWDKDMITGMEIFLDDIEDAEAIADYIYEEVLPNSLYSETIKERFRSMFDWIAMQDINGALLLTLMLIVALVNMSTALLILILDRTRMIGVLKSIGYSNWNVRKVFIYLSIWILIISLIIGNCMGIGFGLLQKATGLIKLNEANYYLSEVPIHFDFSAIILINVGTILVTLLVMVIPTFLVTRIKPVDILNIE